MSTHGPGHQFYSSTQAWVGAPDFSQSSMLSFDSLGSALGLDSIVSCLIQLAGMMRLQDRTCKRLHA